MLSLEITQHTTTDIFWPGFRCPFLFLLSPLCGLCVSEGLIIRWGIIGCGSFSVRLWFPPSFYFRHAYLAHCLSNRFERGTAREGWGNTRGRWCNPASRFHFLPVLFSDFSPLLALDWPLIFFPFSHAFLQLAVVSPGLLICGLWEVIGALTWVEMDKERRAAGITGNPEP